MTYNITDVMINNPPQTLSEEQEMCNNLKDNKEKLKEQLILHNVGLISAVVHKMCKNDNKKDDLMTIGLEGLIEAAKRFNPEKKMKFSNYAYHCIKSSIIKNTQVKKIDSNCFYLQTPLKNSKSGDIDEERNVEQMIYKDIDPEYLTIKPIYNYIENNSLHELANEVFRYLKKTERIDSKSKRMFIDFYANGVKLKTLAEKYHVSREAVRQRIIKILPKIRKIIAQKYDVKSLNNMKVF